MRGAVRLEIVKHVEGRREKPGRLSLGFGVCVRIAHLTLEPHFSKDSPDFVKGVSRRWGCRTIQYEWKSEIASALRFEGSASSLSLFCSLYSDANPTPEKGKFTIPIDDSVG